MASPTSAPVTPEPHPEPSNGNVAASPGSASSGSTAVSSDVSAFLTQFRAASGANSPDLSSQLKRKRDERESLKKDAQQIAKDLKKLRNQKARAAKKTRSASTDDLLQALADRATLTAKKEADEKARRALEPVP